MPRVRLLTELRFNATGYDREPVLLPAGEQDASEALAAFVAANPAVGVVLPDELPAAPEAPAGPPPAEPEGPRPARGRGRGR